jgi:hypothetical protein
MPRGRKKIFKKMSRVIATWRLWPSQLSTSQGRGYHMESVFYRGIAKIAYFAGCKKPFTQNFKIYQLYHVL